MTVPELAGWPALVLTAGLATRLRPLSDIRAKAALPVAGQPLIGRILRWLHDSGVREVVLNLHHLPHTITRVVGDGSSWGVRVRYSWEQEALGSAGGPRHALSLLEADRFLVVNGDTLTNCSLTALVKQHLETGARVTMAVVPREVERAVLADRDGIVTGFGPGSEHFIGVQAVDASVFADLPDDTPYETVKALYPQLLARHPGSIRVYRSDAEFLDVGTAADYLRTVGVIAKRENLPFDRGAGVTIHPTATVSDCVLWDRVVVCEGAVLDNCIVADDVVVPAGTRYERCVLIDSGNGVSVTPF
jgi:mannose-1-phosphate guanylyltransferase